MKPYISWDPDTFYATTLNQGPMPHQVGRISLTALHGTRDLFPDSFSQNHLIVKVILDRMFIKELPSSSSNIYDHDFFYYDNCIKGSNSISRPLTCLPCCTSQLQHRSGSCHSLWSASSYTWWIVPVRTGTLMTSWLCRVEISYWVSGIHWVYYPKK